MADRFPRPYVNTVPKDPEREGMMEYTTFKKMGYGARPSGLPDNASEGPKSLEHVGDSASGKGR